MITIAIDGPSASGKTTTAKRVAEKLNILHLNTGALYRALAVYLIENNINPFDENEVNKVLDKINITVEFNKCEQKTILNGTDVSDRLFSSQISNVTFVSSAYQNVRKKMLSLQREIANNHSLIMEGRDITFVVLPNAKYKFFLSASDKARAKRRLKDLEEVGESISYEEVLKDIKERDIRDTSRANNPLILVKDAILINTDHHSLEEVAEIICSYVKE